MKTDEQLKKDVIAALAWDKAIFGLRGKVRSWQERDAAQGAGWSTEGVRTVVNELIVG